MHPRTAVATALAIALSLAACGGPATATIQQVEPVAATDLIASPPAGLVVLDVRTPDEFSGGHLTGARNIDFYSDRFRAQLEDLDKGVPYLVYCRSGHRSAQAVEIMRDLGFDRIYEVRGGILAWTAAGLPLGP